EQTFPTDLTNPESLAIRALRLRDTIGDHDRAARVCDTLIGLTEKDSDKHVWFLLAAYIKNTLNKGLGDTYAQRVKRLEKLLKDAGDQAEVLKNEPERGRDRREVRNVCRDVTELYDDDTDPAIQEYVKRAAKIAAMVPAK